MTEHTNLFDELEQKAWEIVNFHCVTNGITLTEDERLAVQLGLASGITASIERLAK